MDQADITNCDYPFTLSPIPSTTDGPPQIDPGSFLGIKVFGHWCAFESRLREFIPTDGLGARITFRRVPVFPSG